MGIGGSLELYYTVRECVCGIQGRVISAPDRPRCVVAFCCACCIQAISEETSTIEAEFRHTAADRVLLVQSGLDSYENGVRMSSSRSISEHSILKCHSCEIRPLLFGDGVWPCLDGGAVISSASNCAAIQTNIRISFYQMSLGPRTHGRDSTFSFPSLILR